MSPCRLDPSIKARRYNAGLALKITIKRRAQLGPRAKQQAFDRSNRQPQNLSDFLVASVFVTAEHDRQSLLLRQPENCPINLVLQLTLQQLFVWDPSGRIDQRQSLFAFMNVQ